MTHSHTHTSHLCEAICEVTAVLSVCGRTQASHYRWCMWDLSSLITSVHLVARRHLRARRSRFSQTHLRASLSDAVAAEKFRRGQRRWTSGRVFSASGFSDPGSHSVCLSSAENVAGEHVRSKSTACECSTKFRPKILYGLTNDMMLWVCE